MNLGKDNEKPQKKYTQLRFFYGLSTTFKGIIPEIFNKLPDEQSLDTIIYKTSEYESEYDLNPEETERKEGDNIGVIGSSPEQNMLIEEVKM